MAALARVPLFPFQVDGTNPVNSMSLAGGRDLRQGGSARWWCPPSLPAKVCTWPLMFGRKAAFLLELGFLPVPDFSSGQKGGDAAFLCVCAIGVLVSPLLSPAVRFLSQSHGGV